MNINRYILNIKKDILNIFFLNLKKIDCVHGPHGVDSHLCRPVSLENRLTFNFPPEPCFMHYITILKAVSVSYAVKIGRSLSNLQVPVLSSLLSSITAWTNIAVTMPFSRDLQNCCVILNRDNHKS